MPTITEKRIVATGYAIVSNSGGPSNSLAPGEHVVFDESIASHLEIEEELKSGRKLPLEIQDVDLEKKKLADEAARELQEQLEAVKQEQLAEEARKGQVVAGEGLFEPGNHTVAQVLEYLRQASDEEVRRVQAAEAGSERSSKMIADFEQKG